EISAWRAVQSFWLSKGCTMAATWVGGRPAQAPSARASATTHVTRGRIFNMVEFRSDEGRENDRRGSKPRCHPSSIHSAINRSDNSGQKVDRSLAAVVSEGPSTLWSRTTTHDGNGESIHTTGSDRGGGSRGSEGSGNRCGKTQPP